MRILFVEDDPSTVEDLRLDLEEQDYECTVCNFADAPEQLSQLQPRIVILDVVRASDGTAEGQEAYNQIWEHWFCPVVVYSAYPDRIEAEHPLVHKVTKGDGSEKVAARSVAELSCYAKLLAAIEDETAARLRETLKVTAPHLIDIGASEDLVKRVVRRYSAAALDAETGEALAAHEQYLYPPGKGSLLTGDVLRCREGDPEAPHEYRVVLTPSCDLATGEGREAKVTNVLVAHCGTPADLVSALGMELNTRPAKLKKAISGALSTGYCNTTIPIPGLAGVVPEMTADMRKLATIPLASIGDSVEFERVASVDSPFRELITWAFLQAVGRPGLPEREFDMWADSIVKAISAQGSDEGD